MLCTQKIYLWAVYNKDGNVVPHKSKWKHPWFKEVTGWDDLFVYVTGGMIAHHILQKFLLEGYWDISLEDPRCCI